MGFMNINLTGQAFSDYKLTDVGSSAYQLEHDWFTKEDLVITTGAGGGGTPLSEGVDYQLSEEDEELSQRVTAAVGSTRTVYHYITIINATYQTGDLYHSGKYIADSNSAEDQLPPGVILPFGGTAAPTGWLLCDGSAVSRLTYRRLFDVIGEAFGVGDGSTTFNVPNTKGISLTGVGSQDINGRTKTGPALGSVREDQMQGHRHLELSNDTNTDTQTPTANDAVSRSLTGTSVLCYHMVKPSNGSEATIGRSSVPVNDGDNGDPRTGFYTHGPELGVNHIIKC